MMTDARMPTTLPSPVGRGEVVSSQAGVTPYLHYDLNYRASFSGMLGNGAGSLDLLLDGPDAPLTIGKTNSLAAFGGRRAIGAFVGDWYRFALAFRSNVMMQSFGSAKENSVSVSEDWLKIAISLLTRWHGRYTSSSER